jgi:integrase
MTLKPKLKPNFYERQRGNIQFRKMIRGHLISGSTGMTSIHKVNKSAAAIEHRIISEFYALKKESQKQPRYKDLIEKWLNTKSHLSPDTVRTYRHNVHYYYSKGLPTNCSISRINSVRRDWNIFVRWCNKRGYDINFLEGKTNTQGRVRVLSNSEIKLILGAIPTDNLRDAITFAYYTGTRLKEVHSPKKENLFIENDSTYLKVIKKGGTERIIKINHQALDILNKRNNIFWSYSKGHISKFFKQYARDVNINDVQFHDLRRTFGWNLIKQGVSIYQVSKLLGHKSVLTTERHYAPLLTTQIDEFTL